MHKETQATSQTNSSNSISGGRTGSAVSDLAEKVLIVTCASHGIGAAAARLFSRSGASMVLAAREEHALQTLASDIASEGKQALAAPTDVTDAAAVERLVASALERYGRLDGAFNNAGSRQRPTPLAELAPEEFDAVLDVNLRGVFLCMRAELKQMISGQRSSCNPARGDIDPHWQLIAAAAVTPRAASAHRHARRPARASRSGCRLGARQGPAAAAAEQSPRRRR
jgi:NAD(P)-dependent dehydrogenase (short-subunit alcohol dehydrogenase family)